MIPASLADQISALRAQANATTVPSGLLAWWGRTDFPDGSAAAPTLAQADWESSFMRLQFAALDAAAVPPLSAVKALTHLIRPDGPVPLAIADFRVAMPQADFVQRVVGAANAGTALDPAPGPLASLIEERQAFIASGLLHDQYGLKVPQVRGRSVSFVLDPRFYFTNPGAAPPEAFEVDTGDGSGWHSMHFGDSLSARYATGDTATVSVRCRRDAAMLTARFSIAIGGEPAAPAPDESWALEGNCGNTGRAFVYRAAGRTQIAHPLVIAEGFPGGYACDYLYAMLNQHGTLDALRSAGYDAIFVGFDKGMDRMQSNAQIVQACLRQVMQRTANPLVVGGVSMGGLVARYALADMETRGVEHHTRIFFSIDSPHGGTNTSPCDQWLAQYLRTSSPLAAVTAITLDSPANQQFVKTWVRDGSAQPSPLRQEWIEALAKVGNYPQKPLRLAVASGRGDGQRSVAPSQLALDCSGSAFVQARLWTLPEGGTSAVVAQGWSLLADAAWPTSLSMTSDVSWDGAPGGRNVYNLVAAAITRGIGCGNTLVPVSLTCCVATVSALDLSTSPFEPVPAPGSGASPFHDYICCDENQMHVQFTPAVKAWLLERIGPPDERSSKT